MSIKLRNPGKLRDCFPSDKAILRVAFSQQLCGPFKPCFGLSGITPLPTLASWPSTQIQSPPALPSHGVVARTAPRPIFRARTQPTLHRIVVDIAKFLRKLLPIANVVVVIALFPEVVRLADQSPRHTLIKRFERVGEQLTVRLSDQQVNVLRHHHISIDAETEAEPDALQHSLERLPVCVRRQQWTAMIATERNEVALSGLLKSFQTPRHRVQLTLGSFTHSSQNTA